MRSWTVLVSLAAGLALASCGGATKTAPTGATKTGRTQSSVRKAQVIPPPVAAIYTAALSPYKGGASSGSARVQVGVNPSTDQVCWQFAQLQGIPTPTSARLYRTYPEAPTQYGWLLGHTYRPSGCIKLPSVSLSLLEIQTHRFIVNIHDAQHPEGAVQGAL